MIGNEVKKEMVFEILTPMHRAATDIFRLKIGKKFLKVNGHKREGGRGFLKKFIFK